MSKFLSNNIPWNKGMLGYGKGRTMSTLSREKLSNARKGIIFSDNHKLKLSIAHLGVQSEENHPMWKGDGVGYTALHDWVRKKLGKADHCEECGLDKVPNGKKRYFQWANLSGKYKRNIVDWKQMCCKCHRKYDKIGERLSKLAVKKRELEIASK